MSVDFGDIIHYWGAFHGDTLIGFSINNIYDRIEAAYTAIKLHPDYLKLYPMYALIYCMNEFYLGQHGFEYVNDGWRSLLHETNVQDFLVSKFRFERAHTDLFVHYWPALAVGVRLGWPLRQVLKSANQKLGAIYALEEVRRASLAESRTKGL